MADPNEKGLVSPRPAAPATPATSSATATGGTFLSAIPFSFGIAEDNMTAAGETTITEPLRAPGTAFPRPSVLATIADCVAGVPAGLMITPRLSVTLDIVVRLITPARGEKLEMRGEIVKQ